MGVFRWLFPYTVYAVDERGRSWVIHTSARNWRVAKMDVAPTLAPDVRIVTIRRRAPLWLLWLRGLR